MNTFKKVALITPWVLLLLLGSLGFFYYKDFLKKESEYLEYKKTVENTIKENEELLTQIDTLNIKINLFETERTQLIASLKNKQVQIVEKEKIVYLPAETPDQLLEERLIIPEQYDALKYNYVTLSSLYTIKSSMYDKISEQSVSDYQTIEQLRSALESLKNKNIELSNLLQNPKLPEIPTFQHSVLAGININQNSIGYSIGYQLTILNRIQGIVLVNYPLSVSVLVGVKF